MPIKWAPGLSLYRHLFRLCPRVPIPSEIILGFNSKHHPLRTIIRKTFLRNRADTSPRLVFSALQAGYRSLDLLTRAQNAESPEYAQILSFVTTRLQDRQRAQARTAAQAPKTPFSHKTSRRPSPLSVPLLQKVVPEPTPDNPEPSAVYITPNRPRPLEQLSGKRHIPRLDMAGDFPFLRFSKPQPSYLSRVLTQKQRTRVARQGAVLVLEDELLPEAKEEDKWDRLVGELYRRENKMRFPFTTGQEELRNMEIELRRHFTYYSTLHEFGYKHVLTAVNSEKNDLVARADAMRELIKQETELAVKEKEERTFERRRKWEQRMLAEHGTGWRMVVAAEKRERDARRAERMAAAAAA